MLWKHPVLPYTAVCLQPFEIVSDPVRWYILCLTSSWQQNMDGNILFGIKTSVLSWGVQPSVETTAKWFSVMTVRSKCSFILKGTHVKQAQNQNFVQVSEPGVKLLAHMLNFYIISKPKIFMKPSQSLLLTVCKCNVFLIF